MQKKLENPKFAPLTLDFTFKKAFANEQCKDLLLFLLNTFLKRVLKKPIKDVKIIHTALLGRTKRKRGAVFDVHCEDTAGARFIVEMQVEDQKHFIKRSLFYICMAVANLAKKSKMESKGKKIPYDYNIPVVYTLSFLNFDLNFGKNCDEVVQYISLSNELHPEVRYDMIRMIYVRISKFKKKEEECISDIDKLLFIFKNAQNLTKEPKSFNKMVFKRILEVARISNFNNEELMFYDVEMKRYSDHVNALAYAEEKGILRVARNMLKDGINPTRVARITKLPKEQIMTLCKSKRRVSKFTL